jgi:carbonic anhydrase
MPAPIPVVRSPSGRDVPDRREMPDSFAQRTHDMRELIHGLHRFQNQDFRELRDLFKELAHGQKPETLFITCSDSRIDPNLITGSRPGDLFIIRNAGNIIPAHGACPASGEAATIEFAVAGLEVKDVIVCGHSHCGAMKALLKPEQVENMPSMRSWLNHAEATRRIVLDNYKDLQEAELLTATIQENVLVQIENLQTLPAVAARRARGDLHLHAWVYEFETGEVYSYDPEEQEFRPLTNFEPPTEELLAHRGPLRL